MRVDAGELNKRITIYSVTRSRNGGGYWSEKKTAVRKCWAKISQASITDLMKNNADTAEVKYRFLVRWSKTPIDRKMQVEYRGKYYEIEYINPYGDSREYVELLCSRVTTEAKA